MTVIQPDHTMIKKIQPIVPTGHVYRERNLGWFMTGVFHSRSVHPSRIAPKMPGQAKKESRTRQLSRFLDNNDGRGREWYRPTATQLLAEAAQTGEIRLIIDATKVAQNHPLFRVSLAHRRRSLPIVWTWRRRAKGYSSARKQAALLKEAYELVPADVTVVVTGDSEFTPLQALLEQGAGPMPCDKKAVPFSTKREPRHGGESIQSSTKRGREFGYLRLNGLKNTVTLVTSSPIGAKVKKALGW